MAISEALLYKDSTIWVSQQLYYTRAVPFGFPSNPTVQGYPSRALVVKVSNILVSQQPFCKISVSYGYPSSPTVKEQYRMSILAALHCTERTLWISQQPFYSRTVPMGITVDPLYKDSTIWVSQ